MAEYLGKEIKGAELLKALEDSYKLQEQLYDENLDRMTELHAQINAIKENNTTIQNRMKDLADKIRKVAAK